MGEAPTGQPRQWSLTGIPLDPHTQETGHSGVSGVCRVQIHLVGMQTRGRDGQVAAQPVDVLHERHIHLQGKNSKHCLDKGVSVNLETAS